MKRQILNIAIHVAIFAALYLTFFSDGSHKYAENILKFYIWVIFTLNVFCIFGIDDIAKDRKVNNSKLGKLYGFLNCVVIGVLAAFGWFGYAAMYLYCVIMQSVLDYRAKDLKE